MSAKIEVPTGFRQTVLFSLLFLLLRAPGLFAEGPLERGNTYMRGGMWFQYLGTNKEGRNMWLYPHMDGVNEIFMEESPGARRWKGTLKSRFDTKAGTFKNLFSAVDTLHDTMNVAVAPEDKRKAAATLAIFLKLHGDEVPYYLVSRLKLIGRMLTSRHREYIDKTLTFYRKATEGLEQTGVRILPVPRTTKNAPDPAWYYRTMVGDGYLDVAVVGGNLQDEFDRSYNSWRIFKEFKTLVKSMGFEFYNFRNSKEKPLAVKTINMFGKKVVVRVRITGGSSRNYRIRQGIANFVEGLAHADILAYLGHSNRKKGIYYISETKSSFSKFRVGKFSNQKDLIDKCHGLGRKEYQVIVLYSCFSYMKYSQPIMDFVEKNVPDSEGKLGITGLTAIGRFKEFSPSFSGMLKLFLEGAGAKDIVMTLNGNRPDAKTPNIISRNLFQPKGTYILPPNVNITGFGRNETSFMSFPFAMGSDGKKYYSSEVFPQNKPGEIVQMIELRTSLLGLMTNGKVYEVGKNTKGAMLECPRTKGDGRQYVFLGKLQHGKKKEEPVLLDKNGVIYCCTNSGKKLRRAKVRPPKSVIFVAVGSDPRFKTVAMDKKGKYYRLNTGRGKFEQTESVENNFTPSLSGYGMPGILVHKGK